jgi:UrcA family protein
MRILTLATIGAALMSATAASADDVRRVPISFADLDLTRDADVERLRDRVGIAARRACYSSVRLPLSEALDRQRCLASAKEGAEGQIRSAVAQIRSGTAVASTTIELPIRVS